MHRVNRDGDLIDIDGLRPEPDPPSAEPRPFLAVWYRCCHVYGRLYRNRAATAYEGRCPACGSSVRAFIGPDGTSRRTFMAE
jgi:hypothetical protein